MSFKLNPLLNADSYKFGHINFYPKGTTEVYSNWTPRSLKYLNVPEKYKSNEVVVFGNQAVMQEIVDVWEDNFFSLDNTNESRVAGFTELDSFIAEFSRIIAPFAGANYSPEHLYKLHKVGYLPIEIKTLPEGAIVPVGIPVMTIRNIDPDCFWLTNFLETWFSAEAWQMSTSATIAYNYRKIGTYWYEKTGASMPFLDFAFHDFSLRGQTSMISGVKSGAGHLTSFKGTDTVPSIPYLEYYYSGKDTFIGASVPATEHSIQTAFVENDYEYIRTMIVDNVPTGIVSVVVDGYDYWDVITNIVPKLKPEIMARQPDAMGFNKVVLRPDSGDPVRIVAGYRYINVDYEDVNLALIDSPYELCDMEAVKINGVWYKCGWENDEDFIIGKSLTEAEVKGTIQCLWETFGGTTNDKGYKTLDPHIGLIYGDSINMERADEILSRLEAKGFTADNVVFGVGSYTYQMVSRDTLGYAMKATNIVKDGVDIPLFKDPKTDDGTKKSAKGLLVVKRFNNIVDSSTNSYYVRFDDVSREAEQTGELTTLFENGRFYKHDTLEEIRNRILDVGK
jgi:nicotinamide phosphoribosyltransferase